MLHARPHNEQLQTRASEGGAGACYRFDATRLFGAMWLLQGVFWTALGIGVIARRLGLGGEVSAALLALGILLLVAGVGLIAVAVGSWRAGVYLDPDGLRIRNPLREHHLRWSEIERIDVGLHDIGVARRSAGGSLVLADGRTLQLRPLDPGGWVRLQREHAAAVGPAVEALNRRWSAGRGAQADPARQSAPGAWHIG